MTTAMEIYGMAATFMVGFVAGAAWSARVVRKRTLSNSKAVARAADAILRSSKVETAAEILERFHAKRALAGEE